MGVREKAYVYLLGATALWGVAAPIIKFTLGGIDPFPFLAYRFLIAGTFGLLYILIFKPKFPRKLSHWAPLIIYGLLSTTFSLGLLFVGLDRTTVLELGLIGAVGPLAIVAGGAIFLRERISHHEKIGILIAFAGTILTIFAPILMGDGGAKISGNLLLFVFLVVDTAGVLLAKSMTRHKFDPALMVNMAFIVGASTMIPFTLATVGVSQTIAEIMALPLKYHMGVWYMALISGNLAYFFFIRGERSIEAGKAGLFAYLQPLFTVPLAVFWLGETITPSFIAGVIIVASGVFIAERRNR